MNRRTAIPQGRALPSRAWLGNAVAGGLLGACALWLWSLQQGPWLQATLSSGRIGAAGVVLLGFVALCGWQAWQELRQRRTALPGEVADDAILVAYASQTGFSHDIAERTAQALRDAGTAVAVRALGHVDAATLQRSDRLLVIASTTGEGDPPDAALRFVRDVMAADAAFPQLRYAVLALGDRTYGHFCAFGHQLDDWLRHAGATPLFDRIDVDNGDLGALRHWQHHLGVLSGAPELPDWAPAAYQRWTLAERRHLNPGSIGAPTFHIALAPPVGTAARWQAGDVAEVGPRHGRNAVQAWLQATQQNGAASIRFNGESMLLADALARSHLPAPETMTGVDPAVIAAGLQLLPHREYSIASLPADGSVQLLLRRMLRPDGTPGLGSGWLCDYAADGETIDLRIRHNPNLQPPASGTPMILIGNGTGIAGLRAHLRHRIATGEARTWLIFGERNRAHDFYYREEIAQWLGDGRLAHCDLAFSRDRGGLRYVQDALRLQATRLRDWVADGAALYVCGSLKGMAPGVDAALREVLGDAEVDALLQDGRYRRDVY